MLSFSCFHLLVTFLPAQQQGNSFLSLLIFIQKPTTQLVAEIIRKEHHLKLLLCQILCMLPLCFFFITADSYSVLSRHQDHLISSTLIRSIKHTCTVLTNCQVISLPGQIQSFCSLFLVCYFFEVSIFFPILLQSLLSQIIFLCFPPK